MNNKFHVLLASPRGFCAGVERAIETVKLSLKRYGKPVYVLHEIVHNKHVLLELEDAGAVFVEHLVDVPKGEVCIFSAHGVSIAVEKQADTLGLRTVDATCPLVSSVHRMVERYHRMGYDVAIIGHHKHPEVEGTAGRVTTGVHVISNEIEATLFEVKDELKVAYVTQTTLSSHEITSTVETLRKRFPEIQGPESNICFATQNRQDAVRKLSEQSELIFVVGSKNSSNSNRLREVAAECGIEAYLIDDANDIKRSWLEGKNRIGITAGASAPERLVEGVIDWLNGYKEVTVEEMDGTKETIHFKPAFL